jgi:hypothetical protein
MCCGKPDPVPAVSESGNRMVKMPDGNIVEVTSRKDEQEKRQAVYAAMREQAKNSWTSQPS